MNIWHTEDSIVKQQPDSTLAPSTDESVGVQPQAVVSDTHTIKHPRPLHNQGVDSVFHKKTDTPKKVFVQDTLSADTAASSLAHRQFLLETKAETHQTDSLYNAILHFREPKGLFFEQSTFWHPEIPFREFGMPCTPIPYRISADGQTTCGLMLCFGMMVYMLLHYGSEMKIQLHDFFLPAHVRQGHNKGLSTAQGLLSTPYVCLMLSFIGSIGISVVEQDSLGILPNLASRLAVQGFYAAAWLAYFFCKVNSYSFINWIFFDKQSRHEWHDTLFFISALQAVLLYPLLLVMIYLSTSLHSFALCSITVVLITKVLLLYKASRLFFRKIYGVLHLIVYFCTLEVAPLWVMLKILTQITDLLQVK